MKRRNLFAALAAALIGKPGPSQTKDASPAKDALAERQRGAQSPDIGAAYADEIGDFCVAMADNLFGAGYGAPAAVRQVSREAFALGYRTAELTAQSANKKDGANG